MRYWWVNQNQTYRHEVPGGYLWSPKLRKGGVRNPYYEFMREVAPGDLVFSFCDAQIRAFGVAGSYAYECPKPEEFGGAGRNWEAIGWRVDVRFHEVAKPFRPKDWMALLAPLLPARYSPLLPSGNGLQSIYLTAVPEPLALALAELLGAGVLALARSEATWEGRIEGRVPEIVLWEEHLERKIEADESLPSTEREQLILARRGQGRFREGVQQIEHACRVTRVDRPEHLRASHCKPWRDCSDAERLDRNNGLLLTPSVDHLFDRGFISFEQDGRLLLSPVAHRESLRRMGIPLDPAANVGKFAEGQARFLEYHRDLVLLSARVA
jgi:putative restriction endonuclease